MTKFQTFTVKSKSHEQMPGSSLTFVPPDPVDILDGVLDHSARWRYTEGLLLLGLLDKWSWTIISILQTKLDHAPPPIKLDAVFIPLAPTD